MIPVNQVILGGGDPLLGSSVMSNTVDEQLQLLERYRQNLEAAKQIKQVTSQTLQQQAVTQIQTQKLVWDEIDAEVEPMTDEQKNMLFRDEDYADGYRRLQEMVQAEILNLVKGRIENTQEGKDLLANQLKTVKKLKSRIISETNREMELFRKFKEFSKMNPTVTYEEFIKENM